MKRQRNVKRPQETYYNGNRYRTRLEARWAAFFDALGMEYEYMPQDFLLPNGVWFTPSFKLSGFCGRGAENSDILWAAVTEAYSLEEGRPYKDFFRNLSLFCDCKASDMNTSSMPIIALPPFPKDVQDWYDRMITTFLYIDCDEFACVMAKVYEEPHTKEFELCGDDLNYISEWQWMSTDAAIEKARGTRLIPWEEMKNW